MLPESMRADSWEEPQAEDWLTNTLVEPSPTSAFNEVGPFTGCERLHFNPKVTVTPTTGDAESSSGLGVALEVPQTWSEPETLATPNVKDVSVTLPPGYTINPADGNGLVGCTPAQYAAETAFSGAGVGCPSQSRIGSVKIETPLLAQTIEGSVYVAEPYDNVPAFGTPEHPGGSLLALYVVAKEPERGVIVKSPGEVSLNEVTGQVTSTFTNLPQQPFSRVTFKLAQGVTSPLVSPPSCGSYTTLVAMTPYSAPEQPSPAEGASAIEHGIAGGACPAGGVPPFAPAVLTGTQSNSAGSFSPFYLRIVRQDGEQELTRFSTTLPPGLTGDLTGIPFCPDADVAAAKTVSGAEEEANPSCPVASEVGHTLVGAGVGGVLAWTPGKVYLAGPYNGAPLSLVSITSARVGPFDLGTVVIRFGLNINPTTAQVEINASSDPIPHIIKGIVVHVREIHVYINRPNFTLNPTSCNPMNIENGITGAGADPANPADQDTANIKTPFQAADCSSLKFKPKFTASTESKDNFNGNGASLSVHISVDQGPKPGTGALGEADIAKVKVELPRALPSRLTTLQKACTAAQFNANPAGCPAASMIGYATVDTPILPVPLTGPAIFVSHGGEAFPSLILVLQGYGIKIDLVGATFISHAGITSSTFNAVPDQPFSTFELTLPTGPYSALAATTDVCAPTKAVTKKEKVVRRVHGKKMKVTKKVTETVAAPLEMPTEIIAQNGAMLKQQTKIAVQGCAKAKPKKKAKKKVAKKGKRRKNK